MDECRIIPDRSTTLDKLRTDLANWPQLWAIEPSDVTIGQRIVESIQPFLIDLLQQGLADKTLRRHRDHLQMLGGEIIRRRQDNLALAKQPALDLLLNLVDDDGGPLIWPSVSESAQNAFDATCRKLCCFLNEQKNRS